MLIQVLYGVIQMKMPQLLDRLREAGVGCHIFYIHLNSSTVFVKYLTFVSGRSLQSQETKQLTSSPVS